MGGNWASNTDNGVIVAWNIHVAELKCQLVMSHSDSVTQIVSILSSCLCLLHCKIVNDWSTFNNVQVPSHSDREYRILPNTRPSPNRRAPPPKFLDHVPEVSS